MAHFEWNCFSCCFLFLIFISQGFGEEGNVSPPQVANIPLPLWCHRAQCIAACIKKNESNETGCIRHYSSAEPTEICQRNGCSVNTTSCEETDFPVSKDPFKLVIDNRSFSISSENRTGVIVYQTNGSAPTIQPFISLPFNTEVNETLPTMQLMHFTECGLDGKVNDICGLVRHKLNEQYTDAFKVTYNNNTLHLRLDTDFDVLFKSFTVSFFIEDMPYIFTSTTSLVVEEVVHKLQGHVQFWVNIDSNYCDEVTLHHTQQISVEEEVKQHTDRLKMQGYLPGKPFDLKFNQTSEDSVKITLEHSYCPGCHQEASCIYITWGPLKGETSLTPHISNPQHKKLEPDQTSIELKGLDHKTYGFQMYYVTDETKFNEMIVSKNEYRDTYEVSRFKLNERKEMPYLPAASDITPGENHVPKGNSLLFVLLGIFGGICFLAYLVCILCFCYHRNSSTKNKVQRNEQSVQNVYDDHPSRNNSRKSSVTSDHLTLSDFHKSVMLADHWEFEPLRLKLGASLGKGAFGQVVEGFLEGRVCVRQSAKSGWEWIPQDTGKKDVLKVAVKLLKDFATDSQKQEFLQEIQMMKNLGYHPNVVCLIGCCTVMEPICLVVEACPQGDLKRYLLNSRSKILARIKEESLEIDDLLTSADLLSFARQITMGMEYLSQKGYVHRDLAARNVLVSDNKSLKIADFGLTRYIYEERQYVGKKGARIPVKWMSIEAIIDGVYTSESDVWSFGVVLYEIITLGGEPYPGIVNRDLPKMLCSGFRMEQPEQCPDDLYTMMLDTWHESPKQRPSFTKLRLQLEAMLEQSTPYLSLYPSQAHIFHCLDDIREESDEIDSANEAEPMLNEGDHKVDTRRDESPSKLICNQTLPLDHLTESKHEREDDKEDRDSVLEAETEEDHPIQSLNDSAEYVNTGRQMSHDPSNRDEVIMSLLSSPDSCDSGVAVDNRFLYDSKGRPIEYEGMEQMV
ncbi:Proto-oncogene tyrosine-protein kinase receptor Ret [Holothuria leucospilota]|uniref:Proto-oncogene tyrosine-protein kinase receptor Ret n=1 Tax=Holothuria leucospilota TaxID=206669 RepID=A0A9Q1CFR6_HOLLE|nr:Proto-oncogene tyrosine-protein kinase receptor Ret [Holothuria leucospilota]